jgi:hypothetical protein
MTARRRPTSPRHPAAPHRSNSPALDPYGVQGTTLTLQEWRRTRAAAAPVHHVLYHSSEEERLTA